MAIRNEKVELRLPIGMRGQLKKRAKQLGVSINTYMSRLLQEELELHSLWPLHCIPETPRRALAPNPRSLFSPLQLGLPDKLPADREEAEFIEESKKLAESLRHYHPIPNITDGSAVAHSISQVYELEQALNKSAEPPIYFRRGKS